MREKRRDREKERQRERGCVIVCVNVCMCVCVHVKERKIDRERKQVCVKEGEKDRVCFSECWCVRARLRMQAYMLWSMYAYL